MRGEASEHSQEVKGENMDGMSMAVMILLIMGITLEGGGAFDDIRVEVKRRVYVVGLIALVVTTAVAICK